MRAYTCIICPNGCDIQPAQDSGEIVVSGALCSKGKQYVLQEMTDPRRTISSLARVDGGERQVVGVRLTAAIPKAKIAEVMGEIRKISLNAPVKRGQVVANNILGLGCDLITIDSCGIRPLGGECP